MTLDELTSTTMAERWGGLAPDQQQAIGVLALEWIFAELVADDDGTDTNETDRDAARVMSDHAFEKIGPAVQAALPSVPWYWPDGTRYLAYDRHGHVLGEIESARPTRAAFLEAHRFVPVSSDHEDGPVVDGKPAECLPAWVITEIHCGGRWGAVVP